MLAQREVYIDEFLKSVIAKIASDPNAGTWDWEHNGNGGYLLRMRMDVTGDGRSEIFVASTLESNKHTAHRWYVFDVNIEGNSRSYDTTLNFVFARPSTESGVRSLNLYPRADKERLRISDEKPYRIVRYFFSFPEIKETIDYVSEVEARKIQSSSRDQGPKMEAILLADYLVDPEAKWSDLGEFRRDDGDYYFRPEDQERASKNTAFTPQVALERLSNPSLEATTRGIGAVPAPDKPSAAPSASLGNKGPSGPDSSVGWPIIGALLAIAAGLAWFFIKTRK